MSEDAVIGLPFCEEIGVAALRPLQRIQSNRTERRERKKRKKTGESTSIRTQDGVENQKREFLRHYRVCFAVLDA
jgi:hypothetical protein